MNSWDLFFWVKQAKFQQCSLCCLCSQPPPGRIPSREEQELRNTQLERIHTLFRRQLAVPLMGKHGDSSLQMDWCKMGHFPFVGPYVTDPLNN